MKSQSSTEFMVFVGIAIIILMSYFAIAHTYLNLTYKQRDIISGQDLAKQIKNEINLAARVEDNYQRTFTLPTKVGNKDFTGSISKREIFVRIDNLDYAEPLITSIDSQSTFDSGDKITITKSDGQVKVDIKSL